MIPTPGGKLARNQIKNYFAMVTGVDDQFGRILAALRQEGLERNTIVVFTSDHGNCLGSHEEATKNVHYEESMRVPFLIRWPSKIRPRRDPLLLSTPDIFPTLLDLMGFASDVPEGVQGVSHAAVFLTEATYSDQGHNEGPSCRPPYTTHVDLQVLFTVLPGRSVRFRQVGHVASLRRRGESRDPPIPIPQLSFLSAAQACATTAAARAVDAPVDLIRCALGNPEVLTRL